MVVEGKGGGGGGGGATAGGASRALESVLPAGESWPSSRCFDSVDWDSFDILSTDGDL